jgi:hypothetical protein
LGPHAPLTLAECLRQQEAPIVSLVLTQLAEGGVAFGVVVNPAKSQPVTIAARDRIVVLAED